MRDLGHIRKGQSRDLEHIGKSFISLILTIYKPSGLSCCWGVPKKTCKVRQSYWAKLERALVRYTGVNWIGSVEDTDHIQINGEKMKKRLVWDTREDWKRQWQRYTSRRMVALWGSEGTGDILEMVSGVTGPNLKESQSVRSTVGKYWLNDINTRRRKVAPST